MPKRRHRIAVRFRESRQGWELDYIDHSGRRRRPVFPTEQAALDEAARVSRELAQGAPSVDDPDINLATYIDRWLAAGGGEIEPKTLSSSRQLLTLHVLPTLGSLKVREIRRRHVKGLLMSKRAGRLQREKGKASDQATKGGGYAKAALSPVLTDAIDDGYLETTNPAYSTAYSAGRKRRTAPALVEIRPLSWEDRDTLMTSGAPDRRHHPLFSVLAKTGLRPGEGIHGERGGMPEICRFLGIVIAILYRDHEPPHFHATYGEYEITVGIRDGLVTSRFPRRALGHVLEWYAAHKPELEENWLLARNRQPLRRVEPLE